MLISACLSKNACKLAHLLLSALKLQKYRFVPHRACAFINAMLERIQIHFLNLKYVGDSLVSNTSGNEIRRGEVLNLLS